MKTRYINNRLNTPDGYFSRGKKKEQLINDACQSVIDEFTKEAENEMKADFFSLYTHPDLP